MRMITFTGLAAALVLSATPAFAAKTNAKEQAVADQVATGNTAERKICKRFQNSATRMKNERVCLTKEEWRKFDEMK